MQKPPWWPGPGWANQMLSLGLWVCEGQHGSKPQDMGRRGPQEAVPTRQGGEGRGSGEGWGGWEGGRERVTEAREEEAAGRRVPFS